MINVYPNPERNIIFIDKVIYIVFSVNTRFDTYLELTALIMSMFIKILRKFMYITSDSSRFHGKGNYVIK